MLNKIFGNVVVQAQAYFILSVGIFDAIIIVFFKTVFVANYPGKSPSWRTILLASN